MSEYILSKIFHQVYKNYFPGDAKILLFEEDCKKLEPKLEEFILENMSYSIYSQYMKYKNGFVSNFEYFPEVIANFENFINNTEHLGIEELIKEITDFKQKFDEELERYPYVIKLVNAAKKTLSINPDKIVLSKEGDVYSLGYARERNLDVDISIRFSDLDKLELVLKEYLDTLKEKTNMKYSLYLSEVSGIEEKEAEELILEWTLRNATSYELTNPTALFKKYIDFINDETFANYTRPTKMGDINSDELYVAVSQAPVAYETPYYIRFMIKNAVIELPNIRAGFYCNNGKTIANILAIQTSQITPENEEGKKLADVMKRMIPRSKYFRSFNPSHLISLVLFLGMINGKGISYVEIPSYLPLRYQRFVNEGNMGEEDLHDYQYRLTNKFINTVFKAIDYSNGITILNDADPGQAMFFHLNKTITFDNEFLQYIYNLGYNMSKDQELEERKVL